MKKILLLIAPFVIVLALCFYGCGARNTGSLDLPGGTNSFSIAGPSSSGGTGSTSSAQMAPPPLPASDGQLGPHVPLQVVIRYTNSSTKAIASSIGASVARAFSIGNKTYATLGLPSNASIVQTIKALQKNPDIVFAEPNWYRFYKQMPTGTGFTQNQWCPQKVNATGVWTGGMSGATGDSAVVIGIMDTGVNGAHLDLKNNTAAGFDYADNYTGANEGAGTTSCPTGLLPDAVDGGGCFIPLQINSDQDGHGTLVASTADAQGDDGNAAGVAGICWHCTIEPIKIFGSNGKFTSIDLEVQALVDAANAPNTRLLKKPNVINMSFGGEQYSNLEVDGINYALQNNVTLVASAGNSANAVFSFPAAYPGVLAIGATDANDNLASFSTQGPFLALAAPGVQMYGASNTANNAYQAADGTSFSSPTTSGAVALLMSLIKDNGGTIPSPDKVATLLETTADKVAAMSGANFTPGFGFGRLNVLSAANKAAMNFTGIGSNFGIVKVTVTVGGLPACDWDVLLETSPGGLAVNDTLTGDGSSTSPMGTANFTTAGVASFYLVPAGTYTVLAEPPNYSGFAPTCGSNAAAGPAKTSAPFAVTAGSTAAATIAF